MTKSLAAVNAGSTAKGALPANDVERSPGGDVRDAAELLRTEIDVVKGYLTVMGGLALAAVMIPRPEFPALLQIEAGALEVVMSDLAARCEKACGMADELSSWGFN